MHLIKKEKVRIDDIICNDDTSFEAYPMDKLKSSIIDNGWNPNFQELSYHGDNCRFESCFLLYRSNDYYTVPNGKHRYLALRELGIEEFDAYVMDKNPIYSRSKKEIKINIEKVERELDSNGKGMFQSFIFPYGIELKRRDDSHSIFYNTCWDNQYYVEKDVLDIACNGGYFAIEAKKNGARNVVAFDNDRYMVNKARYFSNLFDIDNIDFQVKDFWNFDWRERKYDIVFGGQFIYHVANDKEHYRGARSSEFIPKALDLMCNSTKNHLVMFTFIKLDDPEFSDFSNGYKPGYKVLERDLLSRGFKEIRIYHWEGAKGLVVASKEPWKYIFPPKEDSKYLVYKSPHIDYEKLSKWDELDVEELKNCYSYKS